MILVTGASGLIGSYIVGDLIKEGYKVKVIKRSTSNLSQIENLLPYIEVVECDILDVAALQNVFKGVDAVIHSAGYISFNNKEYKKLHQINVEGTSNLINASLKNSVRKFIHISSVAAIGKKKGQKEVREDFKWEDNNVSSYAKSKYLGELEVWRGSSEGLNVAILNPSVVLGPGDWNSGSSKVFKYIWDKKPFYTSGNVNFVDVRDVSRAAVALLKSSVINERFILNGGTTSFNHLFSKIAESFNKPAPSINLSKIIINGIVFIERLRTLVLNSNPIVTKDTASSAFSKSIYSNKKARENLQITFKELDETIEWACSELAKKYKLQINK